MEDNYWEFHVSYELYVNDSCTMGLHIDALCIRPFRIEVEHLFWYFLDYSEIILRSLFVLSTWYIWLQSTRYLGKQLSIDTFTWSSLYNYINKYYPRTFPDWEGGRALPGLYGGDAHACG